MEKIVKMLSKLFSGHICVGNIIVYGRNAMHWGVTIRSKKYGYVCFRLPFRCFGKWWPLYWYCSPNATPWAATFMLSHKHDSNWVLARVRKNILEHGADLDKYLPEYDCTNGDILRSINDSIGRYHILAKYYHMQEDLYLKYCQNDAKVTAEIAKVYKEQNI